jgi:hypothetical protein
MEERLYVDSAPLGTTKLSDCGAIAGGGFAYTSEMARRPCREWWLGASAILPTRIECGRPLAHLRCG